MYLSILTVLPELLCYIKFQALHALDLFKNIKINITKYMCIYTYIKIFLHPSQFLHFNTVTRKFDAQQLAGPGKPSGHIM